MGDDVGGGSKREVTAQWPPRVGNVRSTVSPNELLVGDLVFSARRTGLLTRLGQIAGERWRHVGSVVEFDRGLAVVEVFGNDFVVRELADFLEAYDSYGAVRLDLPADCVGAATEWMVDRVGAEHSYAWDDLVLAGLIAATKRGLLRRDADLVRRVVERASVAAKAATSHRGRLSLTCSAFVHQAYAEAGAPCRLSYETWRSAVGAWPPRLRSLDQLYGPDSNVHRSELGDHSLVELLELTRERTRRAGDTRMEPDQFGEVLVVLLAALADSIGGPAGRSVAHDGRWVTPGDLWSSPSAAWRRDLIAPGR